jgi:DNA-binding CsgD family transcriptional regulator
MSRRLTRANIQNRDLVDILKLLGNATDEESNVSLPVSTLDATRELIGADLANYDHIRLTPTAGSGWNRSTSFVDIDSQTAPRFAEPEGCFDPTTDFAEGYPSEFLAGSAPTALVLSEVLSRRQLVRTPMYREFYKPLGVVDEVILWLPAPEGEARCLSMYRTRSVFDGRSRDLLTVLRPHLTVIIERNELRRRLSEQPDTTGLTPREAEVLDWVARGKQNKEIAALLQTSPHTIRTQLQAIYEKLGVHSRTAAVAKLR